MRFAVTLALFCAVVSTTLGDSPRTPHPEPLHALLVRMRAANGPRWRTHITSSVEILHGNERTLRTSDMLGLRWVSRECLGGICSGTYFDGHRRYAVGFNGAPIAASSQIDFDLRGMRGVAALTFLAHDFLADGGHLADGGSRTLDGVRLRVVLVAQRDATPMQVLVDPRTARIRYVRDIFTRTTLAYRRYRNIGGGIWLPMTILRNGVRVRHYFHRAISDAPFPTPHPLALTLSGPNQAIPLDPSLTIPVFPCTLGGIPTRCLLDSGNTGLSVSLELAERLAAPTVGILHVQGLGRYTTAMVRAGPLHFGNASLPPANYAVLNGIARDGYSVIVGADLFAATPLEIDFAQHTLRLNPRPQTGGAILTLHFFDFTPIVAAQLDRLDVQLMVDTGDESNINLNHAFYAAHPSLFTVTHLRNVSGIGAHSVESMGRIQRITLGKYVRTDQPIGVTYDLGGIGDGHLGAPFFAPYRMIFNYAANQLQLIPNSGAISRPDLSRL